jgi:parallel beta helix pectate lyase-like protein
MSALTHLRTWPMHGALMLWLLCMLVTPAAAQVTLNASTTAELEAALATATADVLTPYVIVLAPGFYPMTNPLDVRNIDITIQGDPTSPTTLDGGGTTGIMVILSRKSALQNLTIQNGLFGISHEGGAVFTGTGLTVTGNGDGYLGGDGDGPAFFTNSTFTNNSGSAFNMLASQLNLTNVTVSGNGVGFNMGDLSTPFEFRNTLIVGNGRDCIGTSSLQNLGVASFDSDGTCVDLGFGPSMTTVRLNTLGLGALAANGGPTFTEAISATSPAVNAGDNASCPTTDQRGFARSDGACDIGAYEFGAGVVADNTQPGLAVSVSPAPAVRVTFSQVTTSGNTTSTTGGPATPSGFQVDGIIYDISTTAGFTAPVTVCLPFNSVFDHNPRLFHFENPPLAWVDRTISVDTLAGLVCGTVPSLSPFVVLVTFPFASFSPRLEIEHPRSLAAHAIDSFEVEGRGSLDSASDGIAPDTDDVTLGIGTLSLTIPAGSFVKTPGTSTYHFRGVIAGVRLTATIQLGLGNTFHFEFEGRANLGVTGPLNVSLIVGDDLGQATVSAVVVTKK